MHVQWDGEHGNGFSLAAPCREGLEKKWASFYGKGKSLECRWELFMEHIKGPDSLFVVHINTVES